MLRPTVLLVRPRLREGLFSTKERDLNLAKKLAVTFPQYDIVSIPFLYDLDPEGETIKHLQQRQGDFLVFATLAPRATFCLLDQRGVRGISPLANQLGEQTPPSQVEQSQSEERSIICRKIQLFDDDFFVKEITMFSNQRSKNISQSNPIEQKWSTSDLQPTETSNLFFLEEETSETWYPVIDSKACFGCLECVGFCLFGVYLVNENNLPEVASPEACRNGCPACSRVCPGGAILFPLYNDPAISGELSAEIVRAQNEKSGRDDIASLLPDSIESEKRQQITQRVTAELDQLIEQSDDFEI